MDSLPAFLIVPLGLLAGLFVVSFLSHWVVLFLSAMRRDSLDSSQQHPGKRSKAAVILAFFHPAPWLLLIGVPFAAVRLYQHPPNEVWLWFLGSALVGVVGMVVVVVLKVRRSLRVAKMRAEALAQSGEHVA